MKPFQPRTVEQQRKNYVKTCKQRMARELGELTEAYREEHEQHARLYHDRCEIERRMKSIQDRVANDADKEFGGWDKWRHDDALLTLVVKRMDDAVIVQKDKIDALNKKMEALMEPYHAACRSVSHKYHTLMRTA